VLPVGRAQQITGPHFFTYYGGNIYLLCYHHTEQGKSFYFRLKKKAKMFKSALFCGAMAGFVETSVCHPLDTIKTRIQNRQGPSVSWGEIVRRIYTKEGVRGFYRGLAVVYAGVVPKNAVRFGSFDVFSRHVPIYAAGILAGATEAVLVVNPTDVLKVRVQAQFHSMKEPSSSTTTTSLFSILQKEGFRLFFRGLEMTVLRQAINQGSNFTMFHWLRKNTEWGSFWCGCCSGAIGPLLNNPLDVIKTRLQAYASASSTTVPIKDVVAQIYQQSGWRGFYRGLGSRLMRIVPGQGITFLVYDYLRSG
jgi:solute carrier family 25 citrate transporter 1